METTTRRRSAQRRLGRRLLLNLEPLELRMVLSGSSFGATAGIFSPGQHVTTPLSSPSLSVVSTTPANSAVLTSSPSTLVVTFNQPLDSFLISSSDFELLHLASDGSTSPMLPGEATLDESLDPDGSQIDLTLSKPLTQGSYQLIISPQSQLQGLNGSTVANTSTGLVLSDFTFGPPQAAIGSAIDLQLLGPQETVVSGQLDLTDNPGAVQYYKFELAPGHHWLVGLEISAHRDGSSLESAISLFDSQGNLISTGNEGLSGDPSDPYLFAGLDPGTYYVGISAQKNLPNASGVYDPASSGVDLNNPGGPFQLDVVANVADQPTQLLGLRLDKADPLSTSPTGVTLQFSGGLDMASLKSSGGHPLTLVDQSGTTWPLTPIHYDPSNGQLSLSFDKPLAPGTYTIELAGSNSLLDLAGRAPITTGLPAGTLGSFVVAPSNSLQSDIGSFLPGFDTSGLGSTVDLVPGRATTKQFDVIEPGIYAFQGVGPNSGVSFSIEDGSGNVLASGPGSSPTGETDLFLPAGSYQVVLTTTGSQVLSVSFSISLKNGQLSSLLASGVAQGPALNLRLVTPQANFGQAPFASTPSTDQPITNGSPTPTVGASGSLASPSSPMSDGRSVESDASVAVGQVIPGGPSVSGLFFGSGLAGRLSSPSNPISAVGPSGSSGPSGLAAIASNSDNLPAGLIVVPSAISGDSQVETEAPSLNAAIEPVRSASPGVGVTLDAGLLARSPESRREDDRTLANADWIGQIVANALDWSDKTPVVAEAKGVEPSSTDLEPSPASDLAPVEEGRVDSASMASPFGFGALLGLIAYGYRRKLSRRKASLAKVDLQPILAGPHRRSRARIQ